MRKVLPWRGCRGTCSSTAAPLDYARYLKLSLAIHGCLLLLFIVAGVYAPKPEVHKLKFVVMPKGTRPDAVLTKRVLDEMKLPASDSRITRPPGQQPKPTPAAAVMEPEDRPEPTPAPTPAPTPQRTPAPAPSTPEPEPARAEKGTPAPTPEPPVLTPKPERTPKPTAAPSPKLEKPKPTSTPKPKVTPTPTPKQVSKEKEKATPTPKAKDKKDTKSPGGKQVSKEDDAKKAVATPKQTPKPKKEVASAYDISEGSEGGRDPRLPTMTPAGAEAVDDAGGRPEGVPGVAEGVEGAPLALDANQSALPTLYTNRAILLLQRNFLVPAGVNDPDLTAVVEWEILPDGRIQNAKVVKSTGNREYDQRALDAVEKTGTLGPLPPEFRGRSIWVSLPFIFGQ